MKSQNRIYLIITAFVFLSLILVIFLVYPTFKDIKKSFNDISLNREKAAFTYEQSKELESFKDNFDNYEANLLQTEKLLIDPANPVNFVEFAEKIAADLGIEIEMSIVREEKKKEEEKNKKPAPPIASSFMISAEGNLSSIVNFSEKLEASPFLLQIVKLSVNKPAQISNEAEKESENIVQSRFLVQVMNK